MAGNMERVTLNIPYDMPDEKWVIVDSIYQSMPGWQGYVADGCPVWKIAGGYTVSTSVEQSGLCVEGSAPEADISAWVELFTQQASAQLGFTVRDAEA